MKIKVIRHGLMHYHAQCDDCDWECAVYDNNNSHQDVRNLIRKHVKETKHRVSLETGSAIDYSPG